MFVLESKTYIDNTWLVRATIILADGTRSGSHCLELPEDATDEDIENAVRVLYGEPTIVVTEESSSVSTEPTKSIFSSVKSFFGLGGDTNG